MERYTFRLWDRSEIDPDIDFDWIILNDPSKSLPSYLGLPDERGQTEPRSKFNKIFAEGCPNSSKTRAYITVGDRAS